MIGGNARHAGKTTLACSVIRKFSGRLPIIGLKVTSVYPGDDEFHGDHPDEFSMDWTIMEETQPYGEKDTSRMLQAGATRVFYIRTQESSIVEAYQQFLERFVNDTLVVCESRSLRKHVRPGIFLLMMRTTGHSQEKEMSFYLDLADETCEQGDKQEKIDDIISRIHITDQGWYLVQQF
jgi:hypothetical protein